MAEALIRRGAPMELHNKDKDSRLTMAVGGGEKELVALLLELQAQGIRLQPQQVEQHDPACAGRFGEAGESF